MGEHFLATWPPCRNKVLRMIMVVYRQVYPHFHRLHLVFPRLGQAVCVYFVLWLVHLIVLSARQRAQCLYSLFRETFLPFIGSNLIGPSVEFLVWTDADWWICISQILQCTLGVQTILGGCIVARSPRNEYTHLRTKQHNNDDYWSFHPLGQKCLTASRNAYVNTISIEGRREIRCDVVVSASNKSLWYWASHTFSCEELMSRKTTRETITYAHSLCPGFLALFLANLF